MGTLGTKQLQLLRDMQVSAPPWHPGHNMSHRNLPSGVPTLVVCTWK